MHAQDFEQTERLGLQGIAADPILGLPDGTVILVEPGFVRAVMTARSW